MRNILTCLILTLLCSAALAGEESTNQEFLDKIEKLIVPRSQEAQEMLDQASVNPEIMSSPSLMSHYLNLRAYSAIVNADYAQAIVHLQNARQMAQESSNFIQEAESLRREGMLLFIHHQYAEALALLNKALFIQNQIESPKVAVTLESILNVYNKLEQNQKLKDYGFLLLAEAKKHKLHSLTTSAHYFLSSAFLKENNIERARYHVNAQHQSASLDDFPLKFILHTSSAELFRAEGKPEKALEHIYLAKDFAQEYGLSIALPTIKYVESEILLDLNEDEKAIKLLNEVIDISIMVNDSVMHLKAIDKLAEFYESKEEFKTALELKKQYQAFKEASSIENERKLLVISQARLDISTKDSEIKDLKLEQQLSIQRQQNQIKLTVITVFAAIAFALFAFHLFRQKRTLRETYDALERASNAKSQFLARMSHEIRTPINAIIGLTKLSLKTSTDQSQTTNLQQIEESSQTLLGVINDVLDYSKIEAQELFLSNVVFEIEDVVDRAIRLHSLKAIEKNIELISFISGEVPARVKGDPLRLQQVLNNLIGNAVKFTLTGSVSVTVKRKYKKQSLLLEFEVKDTGIGIESSNQANLFNSFSQADESITRSYGGTGLGLAISKQLVELMGGSISLQSELGQGTTFSFTINLEESLEKPLDKLTPELLTNLKVLVVDDIDISRRSIKDALMGLNINPDVANSGSEGIDMIRLASKENVPYDLLILDWKMPDVDGIEVASVFRQESTHIQPSIIMVSSYDIATLESLGKSLGIRAFLAKPVTSSQLLKAISGESIQLTQSRLNAASPMTAPNLRDKHILLVEDNMLNKKVALGYLSETGAKVSSAENGKVAIEFLLNDNNIDLILMDIQMPIMDGLTATQKIRTELKSNVPIVAMTAHAMVNEVEESIAIGMNAHVAKPIDPLLLFECILQVTNNNEKIIAANNEQFTPLAYEDEQTLLVIQKQKAIKDLHIDEESYQELVYDFINMCQPINLDSVPKSIEERASACKSLHMLKPSLFYIGAFSLANFVGELERLLQKSNLPLCDELEKRFLLYASLLKTLLQRLEG